MPKAASNADGYLLLHKNSGLTSFDALYQVKRALKTGKVGHTGTLDKFAEGLLVLVIGKYTSLVPIFNELDKVYIGTIHFGKETDTLDPEGTVVCTAPVPLRDRIFAVLPSFLGTQIQIPPAYSAIHINGQRASERMRAGQAVEMQGREIRIHELEVLHYEEPRLTLRVHCSKGTYIRALARDIGRAAESCAYLETLHRVAVGPFTDTDAVDPESGDRGVTQLQEALKPITPELFHQLNIPIVLLDRVDKTYVLQGRPLDPLLKDHALPQSSTLLGLFSSEHKLLALIEKASQGRTGAWSYKHVYPH
ncbi:tRNA pseudouridine(55) synthase TruB [Gracilinema caldarium]|uniref:tRNA pseudouridine synthase B n=1 Tax=Gracilinema caldarium (strain ATCC 51460 / DSM 7334 / H1) TaxID=744872 RepID=F8F3C6_GRAC1|nr:tRNA pseudouridine(55) synthase TruB [Gracilinema caldarium]AEJ19502.1 tRNA pseudouridine synthase B [Gracilinema caldarium DSM 7334]